MTTDNGANFLYYSWSDPSSSGEKRSRWCQSSTWSSTVSPRTFSACKPNSAKLAPMHRHRVHQSFHRILQLSNLLGSPKNPTIFERWHQISSLQIHSFSFGRRGFPMVPVDHMYHGPYWMDQTFIRIHSSNTKMYNASKIK